MHDGWNFCLKKYFLYVLIIFKSICSVSFFEPGMTISQRLCITIMINASRLFYFNPFAAKRSPLSEYKYYCYGLFPDNCAGGLSLSRDNKCRK